MKRIGIRELRQQASKYLRDVERGETIEVTDRGRPIARLVPVAPVDTYEELVRSGRIRPGSGRDILDLGPPLKPAPGVPLPSEILAEMRRDER